MRWTDNAGTEAGFEIERCTGTGCTAFARIATVGRDTTEFVDTGLVRSTQYGDRVRAVNAGGSSGYANTATVKTPRKY